MWMGKNIKSLVKFDCQNVDSISHWPIKNYVKSRNIFFKLAHSSFSAGCGRTGTIIAVDYAWTLLKMKVSGDSTHVHVHVRVDFKQFYMYI